jgi:hypothetical protein
MESQHPSIHITEEKQRDKILGPVAKTIDFGFEPR